MLKQFAHVNQSLGIFSFLESDLDGPQLPGCGPQVHDSLSGYNTQPVRLDLLSSVQHVPIILQKCVAVWQPVAARVRI